jgi:hypothetical protein
MNRVDAAQYQQVADELGACAEEALYELACARYDLRRLPETVHGRDKYEIAADALTAFRALPARPPLAEARFAHHVWAPGHIVPAHWPPTPADEFMRWWGRAVRKTAG